MKEIMYTQQDKVCVLLIEGGCVGVGAGEGEGEGGGEDTEEAERLDLLVDM